LKEYLSNQPLKGSTYNFNNHENARAALDYDIIVIGSGPAGLTAAIYSGRALLNTLVIGGRLSGGQLMLTSGVENYPGFAEGIQGPSLMAEMRKQAERFGARIIDEDVESVNFSNKPFEVKAAGEIYTSKAVIIATGSSAKWLGIPSETKLRGRGVSSCATCDGYFFRDKRVAVIGGGDTAVEEALFLTKFASEVRVIHRRDELRASRIMTKRALANSKIKFIWNSVVEEITGTQKVEGVKIRNVKTGSVSVIPSDGVFVAIGFQPNTKIFTNQVALDEKGYSITTRARKQTLMVSLWRATCMTLGIVRQ